MKFIHAFCSATALDTQFMVLNIFPWCRFYSHDEQSGSGPNCSEDTDASYSYAGLSVSPFTSHTDSNGLPRARMNDYRYNRSSKKPPSAATPSSNGIEGQCLLAPETNLEKEDHVHGDARSLNTTSTIVPRTPSFGNKTRNRERYVSGSSCENDTDEEGSLLLQDGYVSARDSGTFVDRRSRDGEHDGVSRCDHNDRDQTKHIAYDLESGVDEGMWGNSSSHSSASTPTELNGLLPLDHQTEPVMMHTAITECW